MIDITAKTISLRTATASAKVTCSKEAMQLIKDDVLPKGNLFDVAKAAGLLAAKRTPDLIPHCHPVAIENLEITYDLQDIDENRSAIIIKVFGQSIARTGFEMEVLTAASITALTIYDLLKPVDKGLKIEEIELLEKTGGRSQSKKKFSGSYKAAILVCSDSTAAGKREDKSGKLIEKMLSEHNITIEDSKIIPDDEIKIQESIKKWTDSGIYFIFVTGGTGLSPRDNTVDAVRKICEKDVPGIAEAMRAHGQSKTPLAMFSRSFAGSIKQSLIICLPGSSNGVRESLEAILPSVLHARKMLKGGGH